MINHFRTLLLNVAGDPESFLAFPGEEVVPAEFHPVELPGYAMAVRTAMFGRTPDRLCLNYRASQYLALVEATELRDFIKHLDPRFTHITDNELRYDSVFGVVASPEDCLLSGSPPPLPDTGVTSKRWRLQVLDSELVRIDDLTAGTSSTAAYQTTSGVSDYVQIQGELFAQFPAAIGRSWTIVQTGRPSRSLGEIVGEVESRAARHLNDLFGIGTPRGAAEPWKTFRNLWVRHRELPYRLGGLTCALVYVTDRLWRGDNG